MSVGGWRQFTPFYFYTAAALCLGAAAAGGSSVGGILSLLVTGLLSWGLVEYALHRFIFHYDARSESGRKFVYAAHLSHHEDPGATDHLFTSLRMSVPIAAVYWLLAWAATGSWRAAAYLFVGLVAVSFRSFREETLDDRPSPLLLHGLLLALAIFVCVVAALALARYRTTLD